MKEYDAIIIGGGPAGSTCARFLAASAKRVAIIDRAEFPRVKLCAGWLSNSVWSALEIDPDEYDGDLWKWNRCHVHFRGTCHRVAVDGYFIRRYQFDDFLLRRAGVEVIHHNVKSIEHRAPNQWVIDDSFVASTIVGAAGTHCPVARRLFGKRDNRPAGARELEFPVDAAELAAARIGLDGEPELFLHSDLRGYSWNVPKKNWLNVGSGTMSAKQVHSAWQQARSLFSRAGHIPDSAAPSLESMKGHSYYLFDPVHLDHCSAEGALLVGDSLGLAHPLTAEGILPAIVSARVAAAAIIAGDRGSYASELARHRLFKEYATLWRLRDTGGAFRKNGGQGPQSQGDPTAGHSSPVAGMTASLIARGFAWMFAGRPLPGHAVLGPLIRNARRWDRLVSDATRERTRKKRTTRNTEAKRNRA